jgi:hypothetical protein
VRFRAAGAKKLDGAVHISRAPLFVSKTEYMVTEVTDLDRVPVSLLDKSFGPESNSLKAWLHAITLLPSSTLRFLFCACLSDGQPASLTYISGTTLGGSCRLLAFSRS